MNTLERLQTLRGLLSDGDDFGAIEMLRREDFEDGGPVLDYVEAHIALTHICALDKWAEVCLVFDHIVRSDSPFAAWSSTSALSEAIDSYQAVRSMCRKLAAGKAADFARAVWLRSLSPELPVSVQGYDREIVSFTLGTETVPGRIVPGGRFYPDDHGEPDE